MESGRLWTLEQRPQDLADDSLPSSTDTRLTHVHGAPKYSQLGPEAGATILKDTLSGVQLSDFPALVIIDLQCKFGDFLNGFFANRGNYKCSLFYYGVCESATEQGWVWASTADSLTSDFESGTMALPPGIKLKDPTSKGS